MKNLIISLIFAVTTGSVLGQGTLSFENTSSTLISANEVSMPVSGTQQFFFALFLATGTSVNAPGQTAALTDPSFQIVAAYNTNSSVGPGRITPRGDLTVGESQGFFPSSTVDFIVRGWSANAGTTWTEALANWNNGSPLVPMFIGSSTVGNDLVLVGGPVPSPVVFGLGPNQVLGFNMVFIPEPSALALAVLGGVTLWARVRWRKLPPHKISPSP